MLRVTLHDIEPDPSEFCQSCGDGQGGGIMARRNLIIGDESLRETICRYCAEMLYRAHSNHDRHFREDDDD
jgi:hypothetical protein